MAGDKWSRISHHHSLQILGFLKHYISMSLILGEKMKCENEQSSIKFCISLINETDINNLSVLKICAYRNVI